MNAAIKSVFVSAWFLLCYATPALVAHARDVPVVAASALSSASAESVQNQMDLNHATLEELQELPKIGPKRAQDIVRYRTQHAFKHVRELLNIRGIGLKTYAQLKPRVRV